jgi:hypothetical protein
MIDMRSSQFQIYGYIEKYRAKMKVNQNWPTVKTRAGLLLQENSYSCMPEAARARGVLREMVMMGINEVA